MAKTRLIWKVMPASLLVILLCTVAVAWFAGEAARTFYESQTQRELQDKARLVISRIKPMLSSGRSEQLQQVCIDLGRSASLVASE